MKINKLFILVLACAACLSSAAQYSQDLVEYKSSIIGGETYSVVKMSRKGGRVKVKYFASSSPDGTLVPERFANWARNKNIITVSSGTYMTNCDSRYALPVGLCVDAGNVVNRQQTSSFDGLAIVYATGGVVATNIKEGNLGVTYSKDNNKATLDIRKAFDRELFMQWAQTEDATVFQTHLFVYKNQITMGANASTTMAPRRFLAVCKSETGDIVHYIINLSRESTIYQGASKALKYLTAVEDAEEVVFMINLDTGCQNVFQTYDANGRPVAHRSFSGDTPLSNAANLIVYYYE